MNAAAYDIHDRLCEEVELRRKEYAARAEIDKREIICVRDISRLEMRHDETRDRLIYTLRAEIYGKHHPERQLVRYPNTWWDAFKEAWAPDWFLRRYPVRYITVNVSLEETYPEFKPAIPGKPPVVRVLINKTISPKSP